MIISSDRWRFCQLGLQVFVCKSSLLGGIMHSNHNAILDCLCNWGKRKASSQLRWLIIMISC